MGPHGGAIPSWSSASAAAGGNVSMAIACRKVVHHVQFDIKKTRRERSDERKLSNEHGRPLESQTLQTEVCCDECILPEVKPRL